MATRYFLGIDVGGTKTHALIADEQGQVVGAGLSGCGNHEGVGYDGLVKALRESTQGALEMSGVTLDQIAGAGFGVAGYDWPSELPPTLEAIGKLGLKCPVKAVNDMVVGLVAGSSEGWGVVVDAGTGNNVHGRDRAGRTVQVTGCGVSFGEYGGAGDIVARAIQMISYEWYHRGPATALTPALIKKTGAKNLFDLMEGLALGYYEVDSDDAPLVFEVANGGDPVAVETIRWVATELAETTCGVIRQLSFEREDFEVVLIGSLFNGGDLFAQPLQETILKTAPGAKFVRLAVPPAVGGVLLGMELAGIQSHAVRERLVATVEQFTPKPGPRQPNPWGRRRE